MKKCDSVGEAVRLAIKDLGRKVVLGSAVGVGSGNEYANEFAKYAKMGEIDLVFVSALVLQKPLLKDGIKAKILNPILERAYSTYTELDFMRECISSAEKGLPLPDYMKYHTFYLMPSFEIKAFGLQRGFLPSNYIDAIRVASARGVNAIILKASCRKGQYNLGTNVDVAQDSIRRLKERGGIVMLLENEHMPYCLGNAEIPSECIDYVVRSDEPLYNLPNQPLSVVEHAIGFHAANLVPDGATLQLGIGQMADAISFWLKQLSRTGINGYSELISPGFLYLVKEGVITKRNRNGALLTGAFMVGNDELYAYANENRDVRMVPITETNSKDVIKGIKMFHSINTALQIDLLTQAASEGFFKGERYVQYSGLGGQFEFQESAMESEGGKSILCMRSAFRKENGEPKKSNIVPVLKNTVGVPRNKMDYVVTEFGSRQIRTATIEERAIAMIELSASEFQDDLAKAAKKMGLVGSGYSIPSEFRSNTYKSLEERFGGIATANQYPLGLGVDIPKYATPAEKEVLKAVKEHADAMDKISALKRLARERGHSVLKFFI